MPKQEHGTDDAAKKQRSESRRLKVRQQEQKVQQQPGSLVVPGNTDEIEMKRSRLQVLDYVENNPSNTTDASIGHDPSSFILQKARGRRRRSPGGASVVSDATPGASHGHPKDTSSRKYPGTTRVKNKAPGGQSDGDDVDDAASYRSEELPGAHRVGGTRDGNDLDDLDGTDHQKHEPQLASTATENSPEIEVATAEVVDEEALERQFAEKRTEEIRNKIISNAVAATEVTTEKTFLQNHGVSCGCFVVAIIVAIVLAVTLSKKKEPAPLVGYNYLIDLLSPISGKDTLLNETTAQFEALNWLANEDTFGIPLVGSNSLDLEDSLVERYVVALLYFSTDGTNWTSSYDFLTNTSVCEWQLTVTDSNETSSDGIRCNEKGFVDSISFESNNMHGRIPSEVWKLQSLQGIFLSNNAISGPIPLALGNMPSLRHLYLDRNMLTGEIPESFGGLNGLEVLSLWLNFLHGKVPKSVTMLPRLEQILMQENFFTGQIPDFLPRGPIRRIKIGHNGFVGTIPDTMYQLSSLEDLFLQSNELEGTLSPNIGKLVSLKFVSLGLNNFSGAIPTQIGKMKDLVVFDIGTNWFTNEIPTEFGELDRLEELVLEENALTGTIPSELQYLPNLWKLRLHSNMLSGVVPLELGGLASLRDGVVFLHNNSLTGSLDSVFCNNSLPPPLTLTADCEEIDCPCCTDCCDDVSGNCTVDVARICEGLAYEAENFLSPESSGTTCQCRQSEEGELSDGEEDFIHLKCSDVCQTCNVEGKFCLEKYDYGFDLPASTGLDNLYHCNMRYIAFEGAPYRNEDVSYRRNYFTEECSLSINGTLCNSCLTDRKCPDGFSGYLIDCSNIEDGAVYDDCGLGLDGGELLQFFRPEYFEQECTPCIF